MAGRSVKTGFNLIEATKPPKLSRFLAAYLETAMWADSDEEWPEGVDFAPEAREALRAEAAQLLAKHEAAITSAVDTGQVKCGPDFDEWGRAGHDFWLTRNGHGAGFWDGDWPEPWAEVLTNASKNVGGRDLYPGDDGQVWAYGLEGFKSG